MTTLDRAPSLIAAPAHGMPDPEDLWRQPASALMERLVTANFGLGTESARLRLTEYGLNDAATEKGRPLVLQFLARFRNPLVIIPGYSATVGLSPLFAQKRTFEVLAQPSPWGWRAFKTD